mgnify:CR=1 FL=1
MSFDLDLTAGICAPAFQDVGDLLEPGGRFFHRRLGGIVVGPSLIVVLPGN